MSVASGYVHISVRNASKAGQASGIRQGFGGRASFAPAGSGNSYPAPGYAPQGYNPNSYGQLRAVPSPPATAPTPVIAPGRSSWAMTAPHGDGIAMRTARTMQR